MQNDLFSRPRPKGTLLACSLAMHAFSRVEFGASRDDADSDRCASLSARDAALNVGDDGSASLDAVRLPAGGHLFCVCVTAQGNGAISICTHSGESPAQGVPDSAMWDPLWPVSSPLCFPQKCRLSGSHPLASRSTELCDVGGTFEASVRAGDRFLNFCRWAEGICGGRCHLVASPLRCTLIFGLDSRKFLSPTLPLFSFVVVIFMVPFFILVVRK